MTLWIAWSIVASILIAVAAFAGERLATVVRIPRRFTWITAMLAATVVPSALALRHAPAAPPKVAVVVVPSTNPIGVARPDIVRAQSAAMPAPPRPPATVIAPRVYAKRTSSRSFSLAPLWRSALANAPAADLWAIRAWLLASTILLAAFIRSIVGLRVRRSRWTETDTEVGRVFVAHEAGPAVVGFFRPRIVIPGWALSLARASREMLLRHEVEHVRAGDSRALLTSELLPVLFPWNAALWWMGRRLRLALEIDCDARVLRTGVEAHEYGLLLLAVGERYATSMPLAASMSESRPNLEARIEAMTAERPRRPLIASIPFVVVALVALTTAAGAPRPLPLLAAPHATMRIAKRVVAHASESRSAPAVGDGSGRPFASVTRDHQPAMSPAPAVIHGLTFTISAGSDASTPSPGRWIQQNFDGVVTFSGRRGRIDIIRKNDVPSSVVAGTTLAGPAAAPGDYYIFDSTGLVLVRPAARTYSRIGLTDVSVRDATTPTYSVRVHDAGVEWLAPDERTNVANPSHSHVAVFWVAQSGPAEIDEVNWEKRADGNGTISVRTKRDSAANFTTIAAGHFGFSGAPSGEVTVTQWPGLTQAMADARSTSGAVPLSHFWLTSFSTLMKTDGPRFVRVASEVSGVRDADIDPASLEVPDRFTQTQWPGFETQSAAPPKRFSYVDTRLLPDTDPSRPAAKPVPNAPSDTTASREASKAGACPIFIVDGIEQSSACRAPAKTETPKCDATAPILVIDGVTQGAPCGKPVPGDFQPSFTFTRRPTDIPPPARDLVWYIRSHRPN
jgi:beta-lactamase regulating signal transducer with metallopeptidase domain